RPYPGDVPLPDPLRQPDRSQGGRNPRQQGARLLDQSGRPAADRGSCGPGRAGDHLRLGGAPTGRFAVAGTGGLALACGKIDPPLKSELKVRSGASKVGALKNAIASYQSYQL